MNENRSRSVARSIVAVLCAVCFLTMGLGTVSRAVAAEDWPVWPKKSAEPGVEPKPAPAPAPAPAPEFTGAAKAGDEGGKKAAAGLSSGTYGWLAAGGAAIIAIAVAAGGGGGGGSSAPVCSQ